MAYLYRHIRLDTNTPFYIGVGSDDKGKYTRANSKLSRNKYWINIVAQTEYRIDILIDDITYEEAIEKEIEFIAIYGRKDNKSGILCNMTIGGEGRTGHICTIETRMKLSNSKKRDNLSEETRLKISLSSKNRRHSEETIQKMRISQVKGSLSIDTKAKLSYTHLNLSKEKRDRQNAGRHSTHVIAYSIHNGIKIGEYTSLGKCARSLNISASTILRYLNGVSKNPLRYTFVLVKKT